MAGEHDDQVSMGNVVADYGKAVEVDSPYYLHPSDHLGLVFVTHPLTENGENYFTWRRNMMTALESKNKVGFIDNSVTKPNVNSQDFQPCVKCNAIVLSWLTNSLAKEIQSSAAHTETARYPNGKKRYRMFDLEDKHIYTPWDVQFFEENYPFARHNPFVAPHESQQPDSSVFGPHATMDSPLDVQAEPKEVIEGSNPNKIISGASDSNNSTPKSNSSLSEISILAKRMRKLSSKLLDFDYVLPSSIALPRSPNPSANSMVHPLSHCLSYTKFSCDHVAFLAASSVDEPKSVAQAVKSKNWREAMAKEISPLEANKTWTLAVSPPGKKAIDSKWVYKIKYHPDGSIERYKAQLVAFAPIAKSQLDAY
ncbi:hypothetical protein RJ639_034878 [Escallonia herrerae]|uniref:Retrotransposon Copia-like N-terminal domain-containing protein n=1 Tax=Escallonia herrerae TaxID=1293975 RepID=A0AA88WN77_9ASTE|nr:hypothetical protein RJ639_034878 [Escallonia herrerae]